MLDSYVTQGATDALKKFALEAPPGMLSGLLGKAKSFGMGQLGAAKSLVGNLRGGLGGAMNPGVIEGAVPPQSMGMARATQRQQAMGNLRTLAPSLLAGGALYMHHRGAQQQQQAQQQQMMQPPMQGGY